MYYSYTPAGEKESIQYYLNGRLRSETEYREGIRHRKILFREGQPVLRILYVRGERRTEERLGPGGEVLERREYRVPPGKRNEDG